jgi:ornithine carbamoyltransferase
VSAPRHFLGLAEFEPATLRHLLDAAAALKAARRQGAAAARPLAGKMLALIFEKPSTRTKVSFEVAMRHLGGDTVTLSATESQLARGESPADTARVLSRYVDAIMLRATSHATLIALAQHATVPVINGLTDRTHPCQLMADILTFEEHRGPIKGRTVAWLGDGNNVATTWIEAAAQFDFALKLACPPRLHPQGEVLAWARAKGARVALAASPEEAARGADCVVTDTWVSMADAPGKELDPLKPYQVNERIMALTAPGAIFMHCLPAKRGQEVSAGVIDGPASVVWDEAENRVHAQKAVLLYCLAPEALP